MPGQTDAPLAWLDALLAESESWLMERVLAYAKAQGYGAFTSTLVEPWRISVAGLSRAIREALAINGELPHEYPVNTFAGGDPIAAFAILEADRHRARGVSLAMFWGLLKYYRRAYLDLLDARLAPGRDRVRARDFVAECFERMEYSFVLTWTELSGQEDRDALARENLRLANEKDKYITVFASIPQALFLLDAQGLVSNCNAAALVLTGHAAPTGALACSSVAPDPGDVGREILGRDLAELLPWIVPALGGTLDPADAQCCREREFSLPDADCRMAVTVEPMQDVSGKFAGRVVLCRDVTEARRAEEALRHSEERYRTLVDLMHQGLVIFSPEGRIDFANDTLCEMLGAPMAAVVSHIMADFVRPEDRERFAAALRSRQAGEAEPYEMALRRSDDGRLTHVMASPTPLIGQDGEYQGSLEVFTDVSRLRDLEMRLITAKRLEAIGQLAGGVAHEINTPLQYVTGNLEFALANLPRLVSLLEKYEQALLRAADGRALDAARADIETFRREHDLEMVLSELPLALSESHAGAERVAAFVRSIKRFAQTETEGRRVIDVAEAVAATMDVARSATHDAVVLEMDMAEDLPPLPCVPGDFNQVLLCLILNAAQAVEESQGARCGQGRVRVSARVAGAAIEMSVHDNGRGIPPEIQEKIFNPFFTTKEVGQGTGQGLSIAHSIMEKHGGTIRFETEPGKGTSFYLTFPLG
jgi:two-component system, NtrC family, sensor kinase